MGIDENSPYCVACGDRHYGKCNTKEDSKYDQDIKAIRFALRQAVSTFERFATEADEVDEAKLSAMRGMIDVFEYEVECCKSR